MSAVYGKVVGGKVVVDVPDEWPEGTEVRVDRLDPEDELPDDEDGSPEAIARRLAIMDRRVGAGPWLTPEEYAAWEQRRAEQKAWELARWDEENEKARKAFG